MGDKTSGISQAALIWKRGRPVWGNQPADQVGVGDAGVNLRGGICVFHLVIKALHGLCHKTKARALKPGAMLQR